jgi:acyl-CoA thioester hydrolase
VPVRVLESDIDRLGHVNNVVYLRWVQEAAIAHWYDLTTAEQQEQVVWVVVRHEIDYRRPALAGDSLLAATWVGPATRNLFERHTEIVRVPDREVLARARTLWCPVSPASGRPMKVSEDVRALVSAPARG